MVSNSKEYSTNYYKNNKNKWLKYCPQCDKKVTNLSKHKATLVHRKNAGEDVNKTEPTVDELSKELRKLQKKLDRLK